MITLRRRLITVIVAAVLPLAVLASVVVVILADRQRENAEALARTQVHRIVELLDRELYNHVTTLRALATSRSLDDGDLAAFYDQAGRVRVGEPHWATVTLADPDSGRQLLDLRQPLGSPLGDVVDIASFAAVKQSLRPEVGGFADPAAPAGTSLIRVRAPVLRAGALRFVLTVSLDLGELQALLATAGLPEAWTAIVADRAGIILARVPNDLARIGQPVNPAAVKPLASAPAGVYRGEGPQGGQFVAVYESSMLSGWSVHAGVPKREFDATQMRAIWMAAAGGVGSLTLVAALFVLVFREIAHYRRSEEALRRGQKMQAIGYLTGGIAHDFNNLLMVIIGNVGTLKEGLLDLDAVGLRALEATLKAAQRGASLTQRLLAFSRQQPLSPRPVDINRLVAGMSELLRRTLGESIAVETVLAGGLWSVHVDVGELESALLNLAFNARDAMLDGGKLTVETANTHLDEAYAQAHEEVKSGQYVQLAMTDTGTGMPPEVAARAFDPFFTTKEVGKGTGLGLSQVYGFVKQSGGHVKVYSEEGHGTTVKIYLPRRREAEEAAEARSAAPAPVARRAERILVVEDDEDVRRFIVGELDRLGYTVSEAASGPAALEVLGRGPVPDLMLTDVGLPGGLNGRQLCDDACRRYPGLKVLYTTGYARNAIVHQGKLDPDVELIVKPFSREILAMKIRAVLDAG